MRSRVGWIGVATLVCGVIAGSFWLLRSADKAEVERPAARSAVAVSEVLEIEGLAAPLRALAEDELGPVEKEGTVIDEAFLADAGSGSGKRVRLVEAAGLEYPVLVVRGVEVDAVTGEERTSGLVEMAADRVIVRFRNGVDEAELRERLGLMDIRLGRRLMAAPVYELLFAKATLAAVPEGMVRLLEGDLAEDLAYVEPNYIVHAYAEPNDPSYLDGSLWGLRNTGMSGGVADVDIDAAEGWDIRTDASSVVVAVIDTGINYLHRDLLANLWVNELEIPGNGVDDDGNGFVDDIHGINAIRMDGDPMDDNGHGTHCSGTIGAAGDDGVGVVGVAWSVKLLGAKFLSSSGSGSTADAITCIDYAVAMGADVLSNSWGGGGYSQALHDAISMAREQGVVFVAAAGNAAENLDESVSYPAGYDLDTVVSVASIDRAGKLSHFSNYGVGAVDLAAPGGEILSTWIGSDTAYRTISGTSMATPHVSGIMALLKAQYPESGVSENLGRLFYGARFSEDLEDKVRLGAVANLGGALRLVEVPRPPVFLNRPDRSIFLVEGEDLVLEAEVESELPVSLQWYFGDVALEGETGARLEVTVLSVEMAGVYRLVARNDDGQARLSSRVSVLVERPLLADAFDAPFLSLYSYGAAEWSSYGFDSEVGDSSLRSGVVEDGEVSTLLTEAQGPSRVSFFWRVSSEEGWDKGELWVDGQLSATFASNTDWREHGLDLEEARPYRLEWRYVKDASGSAGQDALFLDGFKIEVGGEGLPVIVEQPRGGVLGSGGRYGLTVGAAGDGLSYRWTKDGVAVPGAVGATLELVADSPAAGGVYVAIVSNGNGEVRSDEARIQIADVAVRIEKQPLDLVLDTGESGSLDALVSGSLPLTLQWYRDGEPLVGETSERLSIQSAKRENAGEYVLKAQNAFTPEAVSSDVALLVVNDVNLAPRVVKHPRSGNLQTGEELRLSVAVEGSFPMSYQWYKDGEALAGQEGRTLALESVSLEDDGDYFLEARNALGVDRSQGARIRILGDVSDGMDLAGQRWRIEGAAYYFAQSETTFDGEDALQTSRESGFLGVPAILETDVVGPATFSLYWKQEAEAGASGLSLYVDDTLVAQMNREGDWERALAWVPAGSHTVKVVSVLEMGSTIWLDRAELDLKPVIYNDSGLVAVSKGRPFQLWVEAQGAGDLSYQWYRNGSAISGAVGPVYSVYSASAKSLGWYQVDTTNAYGVTRSRVLYLRVLNDLASEVGDGTVRLELNESDSWLGQMRQDGAVALRSNGSFVEKEREVVGRFSGPGALVFDLGIAANGCCSSVGVWVDGEEVARYADSQKSAAQVEFRQRAIWVGAGDHLVVWKFDEGGNAAPRSREAFLSGIRATRDPVFSAQPKSVRVIEGQDAKFQVGLVGPEAFTYRWYKDGVLMESEVSSELRLLATGSDDDGEYWCVATNDSGVSSASSKARLSVVSGFYDALGLDFGKLSVGGLAWAPQVSAGRDGGDALAFDVSVAGPLDSLAFNLEVPVGERRGVAFWIRVSGMGEGANVRIVENSGKRFEIDRDAEWQRVVLPLARGGRNVLTINVSKGFGPSWEGFEVLLDDFELVDEPLFYAQPRSGGMFWGDVFVFGSDMTGRNPKTYRWMRVGAAESETLEMAWKGSQLPIDRVSDVTAGNYKLVVENQKGTAVSHDARLELLTTRYGEAVGAPGTSVWSEGGSLWKVDEGEAAVGGKSLRMGDLGPQESSDLVFWVRGPGVLSFQWKLDTPSGDDRLSLFAGNFQVNGLYASSDWKGVELGIDDRFYQMRIRMSNVRASIGESGQAWVDSIRFTNDGAIRYEDWAEDVFLDTDVVEEERALEADPDGDGVVNFVEYAFAENPLLANKMPSLKRFEEAGSMRVVVDFPLEAMADDVAFGLEVSRDLETWYPLRSQFLVSEENGSYQGTLVYRMQAEERPESAFLRMAVYYLGDSE